ncbi:hypothetical protein VNO77_07402 [Canavalia gladiata]|uniref:Uncharacterized protein n=1 Tax=Canavalia gladiata TaxID=3824 RepID=A0AAN9MEA7_CANGL
MISDFHNNNIITCIICTHSICTSYLRSNFVVEAYDFSVNPSSLSVVKRCELGKRLGTRPIVSHLNDLFLPSILQNLNTSSMIDPPKEASLTLAYILQVWEEEF